MTVEMAVDIVRQMLWLSLLIMTPVIGVGLIVGLVISLFQAVTQIQEQTLTFVPKIVAMILVLVGLIPWIGIKLLEFTRVMFQM